MLRVVERRPNLIDCRAGSLVSDVVRRFGHVPQVGASGCQSLLQHLEQRIDRFALDLVWRVPVSPLKPHVFGHFDLHIAKQASEENHGRFVAFLAVVFLRPNGIRNRAAKLRVQFNVVGADAGLFKELSQSALALRFALLHVALWQIEPIWVNHQQKGFDRFTTNYQNAAGLDFSHGEFLCSVDLFESTDVAKPRLVSAAQHCDYTGEARCFPSRLCMKIYTKKGDFGSTGLFGGQRISKAHPRIEAYGTVDELNSALGMARCNSLGEGVDEVVEDIQRQLFELGSQLATPSDAAAKRAWVTPESIGQIERAIDHFEDSLPPLTQFVLPAGCGGAAALHLARTICRRAERCVVRLSELPDERVADDALAYLNRIGDLLFVLARFANQAAGGNDVPWVKPAD